MINITPTISIKALFIPSFTINLLSVPQLDKLGWITIFGAQSVILCDPDMIPRKAGQLASGLYWVTGANTNEEAIVNATTRSSVKEALQQLDLTAPAQKKKREHRQRRRMRKALANPSNTDPPDEESGPPLRDSLKNPSTDATNDNTAPKAKPKGTLLETWHRRLAHTGSEAVRHLLKQNGINPPPASENPPPECIPCIQGKSRSRPQRKVPVTRASKPFELIHSDIAGSFGVESHARK